MRPLALSPLARQDALQVYEAHLTRDFPPSELKPFAAIARMQRAGQYHTLALTHEGEEELLGYAFLMATGRRAILLDYLGILPERRSEGLGSQALELLAQCYGAGDASFPGDRQANAIQSVIIESEYPPEAPDPAQAERRLAFYRRAGARETPVTERLFGVRYVVFSLDCGPEALADTAVEAELRRIYETALPTPLAARCALFGQAALEPSAPLCWRDEEGVWA